MTRRDLLGRAACGAAALGLAGRAGEWLSPAGAAERPNVLFLISDDLRPELGCFGHPMVKSPNIDRLAAQGTLFRLAYCQQAVCAPSRASFLSGLRPDSTGIFDLDHPLRQMRPDVLTLPQHFRKNGYATVSLGKVYHHANDDPQGWTERGIPGDPAYCSREVLDYVRRRSAEAKEKGLTGIQAYNYARGPAYESTDLPDSAYGDGKLAEAAVEQLEKRAGQPFFMAVGFHRPHLPFCAPRRYWDLYRREEIPLPDTRVPQDAPKIALTNWGELRAYTDIPPVGPLNEEQTRTLIHAYYACVSFLDAQVGKVLGALDRLNLRRNTIVVLLGDHGWKLGEYGMWCKHTNFEFDAHAPLIVSAPGQGGKPSDALVEFVDVYPTLAELCGLEVPKHCEGLSLAPLLKDPARAWKKAAFSQYPRGRDVMGYSLRSGDWRYTEWQNRDSGRVVARELYDQKKGPFADANQVDRPERAEVVHQMEALMKAGWRGALPA